VETVFLGYHRARDVLGRARGSAGAGAGRGRSAYAARQTVADATSLGTGRRCHYSTHGGAARRGACEYEEAKRAIAKFGGQVQEPDPCDEYDNLVRNVSFVNSSLTDDQLLSLTGALATIYRLDPCHDKNKLDVAFTKVTGKGFREICKATNLNILDLSSTLVFDEGLLELTGIDSLEGLALDYTHLPITVVQHFLQHQININDLSFSGVTFADDDGEKRKVRCLLNSLKYVKGLKVLDLSRLGITDDDLLCLNNQACYGWKDLTLSDNYQLTNKCFCFLRTLMELTALNLSNNQQIMDIYDSSGKLKKAVPLDKLCKLTWLNLSGTGISNACLTSLPSTITTLIISNTKTSDPIPVESRIPIPVESRITYLDVSRTGVSDKELSPIKEKFGNLKYLTYLNVKDTTVSHKWLERLVTCRAELWKNKRQPPDLTIICENQTAALNARLESISYNIGGGRINFKLSPFTHPQRRQSRQGCQGH
jgi:hypothetical protein